MIQFPQKLNNCGFAAVLFKEEAIMKKWRKITSLLLALTMAASMVACSGGGESSTSEASTPQSQTSEVSETSEPSSEASEAGTTDVATGSYPREESLYQGGQQWSAPVSANPMAANASYGAMGNGDTGARELVWETMYMYNVADGVDYPLLAADAWVWNDDKSVMSINLKEVAHWSDGTPFTAADVEASWNAYVDSGSNTGIAYSPYVADIVATGDYSIEVQCNMENHNVMKVEELVRKMYIMQKAYLDSLSEKTGGDATAMKNETMWDAPSTAPYHPLEQNDQKWVILRDDNYWGQHESMWGKLPVPKYIIHNIYSSNDVAAQAFKNGEIDINQSYTANIQTLWEDEGLPISTYMENPPYNDAGVIPTVVFNVKKPGLDQVEVRKAIAMAVDYEQIIASAMTGQSPTFEEYPRTLFNWSEAQQGLILDKEALSPLQWTGNDAEGAKALLDGAGIVDTNGDGNREYNGEELSFKVECPTGWSDYEAALNIVQEAGKKIGIAIETYYPESAQVTDDLQSGNFDISLTSYAGTPYGTFYFYMYGFGGEFPETMTTNQGRWYNEEADTLIEELANTTDETRQKEIYQRLNEIYLTEVPSFGVMYRPYQFMSCYEGVWTNFPNENDGSDPKIPAMMCTDGYGVAALYNLQLVEG